MRALLSVYDKEGLVELAQGLSDLGWELVASGNTAGQAERGGHRPRRGGRGDRSPEMLGGRVKTLHPKIHGGILADRAKPEHLADLEGQRHRAIDLVVSNLYPFSSDPSIELIDIGGPTMVRAAAKNHEHVGIVTSPADYPAVLAELRGDGSLSAATRRRLARAAFAHTAAYDAAIVAWLDAGGHGRRWPAPTAATRLSRAPACCPRRSTSRSSAPRSLRYGENPHQRGSRYRIAGTASWWDEHGPARRQPAVVPQPLRRRRRLAAGARAGGGRRREPAVAIIKHANPCGAAVAADLVTAYERALECDVQCAFGGIVAIGGESPPTVAEAIAAGPPGRRHHRPVLRRRRARKLTARRKATRLLSAPAPERRAPAAQSWGQRAGPGRRRLPLAPLRVAGRHRAPAHRATSGATWRWPGGSAAAPPPTPSPW